MMKFILAAAMAVLFATGASAWGTDWSTTTTIPETDCGCGSWSGSGNSQSSGWTEGGVGGDAGYNVTTAGTMSSHTDGYQHSDAGGDAFADKNSGNQHTNQYSDGGANMSGAATGSGFTYAFTDFRGASTSWAAFNFSSAPDP